MPTPTPSAQTPAARFAAALSRHVSGPVADDAELTALGLDSLTLVRIVVHFIGEDSDREIDLGTFEELRTVADLRCWLTADELGADAKVPAR
jgi:acyl carrier protein